MPYVPVFVSVFVPVSVSVSSYLLLAPQVQARPCATAPKPYVGLKPTVCVIDHLHRSSSRSCFCPGILTPPYIPYPPTVWLPMPKSSTHAARTPSSYRSEILSRISRFQASSSGILARNTVMPPWTTATCCSTTSGSQNRPCCPSTLK